MNTDFFNSPAYRVPPIRIVRCPKLITMKVPERVFEAAVGRAGVDEKRVPQLAHVAEALYRGRVHHGEHLGVQPDVVPERVADDLELGRSHARGPASRTA